MTKEDKEGERRNRAFMLETQEKARSPLASLYCGHHHQPLSHFSTRRRGFGRQEFISSALQFGERQTGVSYSTPVREMPVFPASSLRMPKYSRERVFSQQAASPHRRTSTSPGEGLHTAGPFPPETLIPASGSVKDGF